MMTEPEQATPARDLTEADRRYRAAEQQPRGDWGNVGFVILDDDEEDGGPDNGGR